MNFSVVIPTKDRPKLLRKTLLSVENAAKFYDSKIEVLCVNNGSRKKASDLVFSYKSKSFSYIALEEEKRGPTFARNKGILKAQWKHVIFIDDDCKIKPNHFVKYRELWTKNKNARAIGGRVEVKKEKGGFTKREKRLLEKHGWCFGFHDYGESKKLQYGQLLYGANMSIRLGKNIQDYLFNENLGREMAINQVLYAEDYELCNRLILNNEEVFFDRGISVVNFVPNERFTDDYIFQRYWKFGIERYISDRLLQRNGGRTFNDEFLSSLSVKNILLGKSNFFSIFRTRYNYVNLLSYYLYGKQFLK